jgi:hypothetical protein
MSLSRIAFIALAFTVSCVPSATVPLTQASPKAARIYIINDVQNLYGMIAYRVIVDGRRACDLRGEQYAVIDLEPGRHRFYFEGTAALQDIDFDPGVTYLKIDIPRLREASLVRIDSATASARMAVCQRVATLLPPMVR